MINHRVNVRVTQSDGVRTEVLQARECRLYRRFLRFLLGDEVNVLVISPSDTVNAIEITEVPKGGSCHAGAS